jgi:hypothetical protein
MSRSPYNLFKFHPLPLPVWQRGVKGPLVRRVAGLQEFSSVGRASVSKTEGRGFESLNSCHFLFFICFLRDLIMRVQKLHAIANHWQLSAKQRR